MAGGTAWAVSASHAPHTATFSTTASPRQSAQHATQTTPSCPTTPSHSQTQTTASSSLSTKHHVTSSTTYSLDQPLFSAVSSPSSSLPHSRSSLSTHKKTLPYNSHNNPVVVRGAVNHNGQRWNIDACRYVVFVVTSQANEWIMDWCEVHGHSKFTAMSNK